MQKNSILLALPVLALAALTACGGGSAKRSTTTTTVASPAASPAGGAMRGAMANATQAPVPASLHCGAVAPVWVNTSRHNYHTSADPYYGRTKHGEYMCAATAIARGYHAAGTRGSGSMRGARHHKGSSMSGAMNGAAAASPAPSPT